MLKGKGAIACTVLKTALGRWKGLSKFELSSKQGDLQSLQIKIHEASSQGQAGPATALLPLFITGPFFMLFKYLFDSS